MFWYCLLLFDSLFTDLSCLTVSTWYPPAIALDGLLLLFTMLYIFVTIVSLIKHTTIIAYYCFYRFHYVLLVLLLLRMLCKTMTLLFFIIFLLLFFIFHYAFTCRRWKNKNPPFSLLPVTPSPEVGFGWNWVATNPWRFPELFLEVSCAKSYFKKKLENPSSEGGGGILFFHLPYFTLFTILYYFFLFFPWQPKGEKGKTGTCRGRVVALLVPVLVMVPRPPT